MLERGITVLSHLRLSCSKSFCLLPPPPARQGHGMLFIPKVQPDHSIGESVCVRVCTLAVVSAN